MSFKTLIYLLHKKMDINTLKYDRQQPKETEATDSQHFLQIIAKTHKAGNCFLHCKPVKEQTGTGSKDNDMEYANNCNLHFSHLWWVKSVVSFLLGCCCFCCCFCYFLTTAMHTYTHTLVLKLKNHEPQHFNPLKVFVEQK